MDERKLDGSTCIDGQNGSASLGLISRKLGPCMYVCTYLGTLVDHILPAKHLVIHSSYHGSP